MREGGIERESNRGWGGQTSQSPRKQYESQSGKTLKSQMNYDHHDYYNLWTNQDQNQKNVKTEMDKIKILCFFLFEQKKFSSL